MVDVVLENLHRAVEQLLGRASGPLHLRLLIQPLVAAALGVRAGLRDARDGRPAFLWEVLSNPAERKALWASGWKDVGRIVVLAVALDTLYQFAILRTFYPLQAAIVAVVVALVPYVVVRGPANRVARGWAGWRAGRVGVNRSDP